MTQPPRVLILLNPGDTSRHYLLGLRGGAERAGATVTTLELGPVWKATRGPNGPAAAADLYKQAYALCRRDRITHVISYVFNGVTCFGLAKDERGHLCSPFTRAGCRHILLWTDHPNWAYDRAAFRPACRQALSHPLHSHILKSRAAADEAAAIMGWANVSHLPMAEHPSSFDPAGDTRPIHDVVALLSDAGPVPEAIAPWLTNDDPDPLELMRLLRPAAAERARALLNSCPMGEGMLEACERLFEDWLDEKLDRPLMSFWSLADRLRGRHAEALGFLAADPARWFDTVAALRTMTDWRRNFWLAWLGRRVNLGIYGSSAAPLGLAQSETAAKRVPYRSQSRVYALGRCSININAGHDEEGMTHKPFQIAASNSACVHHDTLGLAGAFEPGTEIIAFQRGPELLNAVRALSADEALRRRLAQDMRGRLDREHTWAKRSKQIIEAAPAADALAARARIPAAA